MSLLIGYGVTVGGVAAAGRQSFVVAHQLHYVLTSWPRLMVMYMASLLKFLFIAAQADTTLGAAVALPVAGHAVMAAPITDQEAIVAGATQACTAFGRSRSHGSTCS